MIGTTRSRVSFFMNKFRELGLYCGEFALRRQSLLIGKLAVAAIPADAREILVRSSYRPLASSPNFGLGKPILMND